ncbi:MAG: transketolase C-terminal domain-containing protein [Synergistaceae bacterium]
MTDNKNNMWSAFTKYIMTYASQRDDFILLATEKAKESTLVKNISDDKKFLPMPSNKDLILAAAGLALSGKRPWIIAESADILVSGYAEIRNVLAFSSLPVSIAVANAGLAMPNDGAMSNILEDVSLMRTIPGMNVLVPSTPCFFDEKNSVLCSYKGPVYIKLSTEDKQDENAINIGDVHHGGSRILSTGSDVTICACGNMVEEALKASKVLLERGISSEIIDCYRIKPFSERFLLASVRKTGCCVVTEEHSVIGGLFAAVSSCLSQTYPVPVRFVAVDEQVVSAGNLDEVREYYGLTWREIVNAATQVYALRRR